MFKWTIARKVGGLAAVLITFILVLIIYSVVSLQQLQAELKVIDELDVALIEITNNIEIHQLKQRISIEQLIQLLMKQSNSNHSLSKIKTGFLSSSKQLSSLLNQGIVLAEQGIGGQDSEQFVRIKQSFIGLDKELSLLKALLATTFSLVKQQGHLNNENIAILLEKMSQIDQQAIVLIQTIETFTERQLHITRQHERIFSIVNTCLGIAAVVLGILFSMIIIIGIKTNIFRLSKRIDEVSKAITNSQSIPEQPIAIDSSDEILELGNNLNTMIDNVSKDMAKRDQLAKQLQTLATTDRLTKAFNRFKWDETIHLEMERVKRSDLALSIILFDIDFFKKINDNYGHDIGDSVLIEITQLIQQQIRKIDSLYRVGGEEFIVLLPDTEQQKAVVIAEKIRQIVADHSFSTVGQVTISMGLAEYKTEDTEQTLVKRADQALYQAKQQGRNQVVNG